ncbi:MAG: SDR family NAD(P)-dependent oxidoreductase, partial [Spirochaetia bacterium]|nr:SDR family NAD(P)-dependent oxidoreductase [Spirochaetia bacterium]
ETADGIEMQFAANVLNYFWMSLAFRPHLKKTASDNRSARIVNVASFWAGDLDLNDLEFKKRRYSNNTAYRQSRQANRMLTAAFAEKFKGDGITVNSCHPGEVNSALSNSMGFGGRHSPDQGAQTPVWLATSDDVENITGKWFSSFKSEPCPFSRDKAAIEELYGICEKYSKEIL